MVLSSVVWNLARPARRNYLAAHISAIPSCQVANWGTVRLVTGQLAPARPVWPIAGSSLWANNINNTHFVSLPAIQPPACEPAACILAFWPVASASASHCLFSLREILQRQHEINTGSKAKHPHLRRGPS